MAATEASTEQVSLDLFVMTYGAMVAQLLEEFEDPDRVNSELESLGQSIGERIADDFIAKADGAKCGSFRAAMDTVATRAFPMYLGMAPTLVHLEVAADAEEQDACTLTLGENPLARWVELPEAADGLSYSNMVCGALKGALEVLRFKVTAEFTSDVLRGDDDTVIRVGLTAVEGEETAEEYDMA